MESEKKRNSQVEEKAEKIFIDASEMCAVEGQHGPVQSFVSLANRSVVGDVLDEGVVAAHMQKATMRAVVHPPMIKAVSEALLKNGALMAPIVTFVSN